MEASGTLDLLKEYPDTLLEVKTVFSAALASSAVPVVEERRECGGDAVAFAVEAVWWRRRGQEEGGESWYH